jgi:tetratricopeptide (TPR) repeat protein
MVSRHRWLLAVLALVVLATLPKFGNGFVWDDEQMIVEGSVIHDPANLPALFLNDTMYSVHGEAYGATAKLDTYRPVTMSTFVWDAAISGRDPFSYHLTNELAHLAVVALTYLLALALLGGDGTRAGPAAFAAGFVGLHPMLGEAHLWINGRSDVFAGAFGVAAVLAWLRWLRGGGGVWIAGAMALLLAGLLSKEVLLPALPALAFLAARERGWRGAAGALAPLVGASLVALGMRAWALSGMKATEGGGQTLGALKTVPWLMADGLRALLLPTRTAVRLLSEEYAGMGVAHVAVGLVVVTGVGWLASRAWPAQPGVAFGLAWAGGALAPVALIASSGWWGFGRYLYLPAIGLGIALAGGWCGVEGALGARARRGGAWAAGAVLTLFAVLLFGTTATWRDRESLSRAVVLQNPDISLGWLGLAAIHEERGEHEEALRLAREAVARSGASDKASAAIGGALLALGRPGEAVPHLERAVAGQGFRLDLAYNLGLARLEAGQLDAALASAAEGQARFPDRAAFFHLQALIVARHDAVGSLDFTVAALEREPEHAPSRALPGAILASHPQAAAYRAALEARVGRTSGAVAEVVRGALAAQP